MINVEAEVKKHRNCRDRDELGRQIKVYKDLAFQYASDIVTAGQYNMVAFKLQEIYDSFPAPRIKVPGSDRQSAHVKTATITDAENARIHADWKKKTGK